MAIRRFILYGMIVATLLALTACDSTGTGGSQSPQTVNVIPTTTPLLVTPRSSSGSSGQGPEVVATPSPVPGGPKGSQEVVLSDRTLIIYGASEQKSTQASSVLINLDLAVHNTSGKAIKNLPAFFQLVGMEGDTFSYQYNSTDTFYGSIAAHTTDRGLIVFQIPLAAGANVSLLYRPEIAKETAIIQLKIV